MSARSLVRSLARVKLTDRQTQWYQLYVNGNRSVTEEAVCKAQRLGCTALFVTVDAPALGRREKDMRNKYTKAVAVVQHDASVNRNQGAARALSSFIDPSLCWNDIAWLKSLSNMKIALKGIQVSIVLASCLHRACIVLASCLHRACMRGIEEIEVR